MAEALLLSRTDVFMRLVVGTSGFSTFAYLTNALRSQGDWATTMPELRKGTERHAPNYVVTKSCEPGGCFVASPKLRMADISWHGDQVMKRSCGDLNERLGDGAWGELKCAHVGE